MNKNETFTHEQKVEVRGSSKMLVILNDMLAIEVNFYNYMKVLYS